MHVIPGLAARTGGPAVSVVEASLALRELGVESTLFATDLAEAASAARHRRASPADLPRGAEDLDVRLFPACLPYRLAFSPALYQALAQAAPGYDAVHIHSLFLFPQFAAYQHARQTGVPYVVSPRGALDPYLRRRGRIRKVITDALWQRTLLERACALHLTSDDEARLIADVVPSVPRVVVPNGIRWAEYHDLPNGRAFRERRLAGHDGPILLTHGRIARKKGLDVLIRAFALVSSELPDTLLVLAGPDDERLAPRLAALAERHGVRRQVVFTGMLRREERLAALAAADVWALPSHTENFGLAVVEALAAGLPVVVSPAVNIATEVAAAGAGVVCSQSTEALASELAALVRDGERREALGRRARAFARRYDWQAVAPQLASMYAELGGRP